MIGGSNKFSINLPFGHRDGCKYSSNAVYVITLENGINVKVQSGSVHLDQVANWSWSFTVSDLTSTPEETSIITQSRTPSAPDFR